MEECCLDNRIYYRKNNFKEGRKTIFFVHGLSSHSGAWKKFEKKFEKNYNLILIDLRGHGKSHRFRSYEDYTIHNFSKDIFDILKKEKIAKTSLVCHSFSCFIGLYFTKHHQNMLDSLILLSPAYEPPMNWVSRLLKRFLYVAPLDLLSIFKKRGCHFDYTPYEGTGDWNLRRLFRDIRNTTLKVYLFSTKQTYTFNEKALLKKIRIPVLLIQGKEDTIFFHKNYLYMKEKIKKSTLHLLEGSHVLVLNNFSEVSKIIKDFIGH